MNKRVNERARLSSASSSAAITDSLECAWMMMRVGEGGLNYKKKRGLRERERFARQPLDV